MAQKTKRLGKGLGALMKKPVEVDPEIAAREASPASAGETSPAAVEQEATASVVEPSLEREAAGTTRGRSTGKAHAATPVPRGTRVDELPAAEAVSFGGTTDGVRMIPIESISPNPFQPRREFDQDALQTLSDSLRTHGVLQPIVVRPVLAAGGAGGGAAWELVAGERRWRAAKLAGLSEIPAMVKSLDDQASAEVALVENLQREDLNVVERASALKALCETCSLTHGQAGERVGLDRATVSNLIRLLELDESSLSYLSSGLLSMGHGRALLGERSIERRSGLAQQAAQEQWSVRELERRVRAAAREQTPRAPKSPSPAIADLERRLGEQLGTKVAIRTDRTGKKGAMTIEFYGLEHFEALVGRMGIDAGEHL